MTYQNTWFSSSFCPESPLFSTVLPENCISLNQLELSIFSFTLLTLKDYKAINILCVKLKLVSEDIFQPKGFLASHQYTPSSVDVILLKDISEARFTTESFSSDTGTPSLNHVITGRGMPDASHLIFTTLPEETGSSRGGILVNVGGEGARMN